MKRNNSKFKKRRGDQGSALEARSPEIGEPMIGDRPWLRFESGEEADLEAFLKSADAQHPVRVVLGGEQWGTRACEVLAGACPEIDLRVVYLRGTCIGDAGINILASSTVLRSVRSLGVERCGLSNLGVERLARCPSLHNLRELYLCNRVGIETRRLNEIGDEGAIALAGSPNLSQLETLDLWSYQRGRSRARSNCYVTVFSPAFKRDRSGYTADSSGCSSDQSDDRGNSAG